MSTRRPVRIANCSGFFGDRLAAAREMVDGGPIDVLTGDWLAELTMLILARQRLKHGAGSGYARTFLTQMADVLGDCLDRGIKVVSNAGGLDPQGCAEALRAQAEQAGLGHVRIAWVDGDDLMPRMQELTDAGEKWVNLDTGVTLVDSGIAPLTANAYIGAEPIAAALAAGADVVITGRCTDAALVMGPAAWWHDWSFGTDEQADLDRLAGAVVAGHVIECGAQATGGNYSFFTEVPGNDHVGFPIAEVAVDGSSVITKHPGAGGLVSVGTVTAQLLYEIAGPRYASPDVVARFDTIALSQEGPDRVSITSVRGEPAPDRLKVAITHFGGFRNSMTLVITGMDVREKADVATRQVLGLPLERCLSAQSTRELAAASTLPVEEVLVRFVKHGVPDPATVEGAQSLLQIAVKDSDPKRAGRAFTSGVVEAALASYPGMFPTAPPGEASPYGVYWPTTVAADQVTPHVRIHHLPTDTLTDTDNHTDTPTDTPTDTNTGTPLPPTPHGGVVTSATRRHSSPAVIEIPLSPAAGQEPTLTGTEVAVPLGLLVGARSGDKGGNANIGLWIPVGDDPVRAAKATDWFTQWMTPERVHALLPETVGLTVECFPLPNLRAVNVVVQGLLGRGVADSDSLDPQAKGLGEQVRARFALVPRELLDPRRLATFLADHDQPWQPVR